MTDIVSLHKDFHRFEHLGLTLAESKQLLDLIQKKLLEQQIEKPLAHALLEATSWAALCPSHQEVPA